MTGRFGLAERVATVAGVATTAAMIATPLLPQRGAARRVLSSVVVGGLFVSTTANAVRRWGGVRAGGAAASTVLATAGIERVGTATGLPFGRYAYTPALQPQIAHVPAIVPLAWFAMALPAREAAHAALGPRSTPATRAVLGSAALTAWDLFLDPQMVGEGYWNWARRGWYRGIPLTNFVGWFVTGLGVMAALDRLLPPAAPQVTAPPATPDTNADDAATSGASGALVGIYSFMAVMETIGFARYFRDRLVAAVGGAAMLPIAGAAVAGLLRPSRHGRAGVRAGRRAS